MKLGLDPLNKDFDLSFVDEKTVIEMGDLTKDGQSNFLTKISHWLCQ